MAFSTSWPGSEAAFLPHCPPGPICIWTCCRAGCLTRSLIHRPYPVKALLARESRIRAQQLAAWQTTACLRAAYRPCGPLSCDAISSHKYRNSAIPTTCTV